MVHIVFNDALGLQNVIWSSSAYFDSTYENSWFTDPLVQKIAQEVDQCTYYADNLFRNPVFGYIPAEKLSADTKTLILALKADLGSYLLRLSTLGDNCYKYLALFPSNLNPRFYGNCNIKSADHEVKYFIEDTGAIVDNVVSYMEEMPNDWLC